MIMFSCLSHKFDIYNIRATDVLFFVRNFMTQLDGNKGIQNPAKFCGARKMLKGMSFESPFYNVQLYFV